MSGRIIELTHIDGRKIRLRVDRVDVIACESDKQPCQIYFSGSDVLCPVQETYEQVCALLQSYDPDWARPMTVQGLLGGSGG